MSIRDTGFVTDEEGHDQAAGIDKVVAEYRKQLDAFRAATQETQAPEASRERPSQGPARAPAARLVDAIPPSGSAQGRQASCVTITFTVSARCVRANSKASHTRGKGKRWEIKGFTSTTPDSNSSTAVGNVLQ